MACPSLMEICIDGASIFKQCFEPRDLEMRFHKLNNGLDMRALLIPHSWSNLHKEYKHLYTLTNSHDISRVCPNTIIRGNYPLMIRTSCPWFLDTDYSEERYPRHITFANTRCSDGCIESNGEKICERIHHQIRILKKTGCKQNVYHYKVENFLLPIGYTCAHAREVENSVPVSLGLPKPL